MTSADRISGIFFLLFGLALYFFVIPAFVEIVEDGNIRPDTLPNTVSIIIAACGALLVLKPTGHRLQNAQYMLGALTYVAVLGGAIYATSWFGFLYVSPFLALVIMLMIGERRPLWILGGMIGVPATIWLFVVQLLDRPLP